MSQPFLQVPQREAAQPLCHCYCSLPLGQQRAQLVGHGSPADGQNLRLRMSQDNVGSHAISFGNQFVFGTDVTSALIPSAANAAWEMLFTWDDAAGTWRAVAIIRGF